MSNQKPKINLSSYCGLVDAKIRASDKDLPVSVSALQCEILNFRKLTYIKNLYFFFRCGGQGDLLSGTLAVFLYWAAKNPDCPEPGPGVIAGWASARLARACSAQGSTHI